MLPELGAKGAGFCDGSPFSAQGQEFGSEQHPQDSVTGAQVVAATAPGNTWANCKSSPRMRVMVIFKPMAMVRVSRLV